METKDRILESSIRLFLKYGIRAITMDRIAVELGISKRTIYELFNDKDDLLFHALQHFTLEQKKLSMEMIRESSDVIDVIFRFAARQSVIMREVNPQFVHDLRKYHARVYRKIAEKNDIRDLSLTRSFLTTGIEQGIFREDMNIDLVNLFLHQLMDQFGPEADEGIQKYGHQEVFENVFLAYIRGICTPKGVKLIGDHAAATELNF